MLSTLPIEIIRYEIFPHLDESAKLVLSNVMWNTPIPTSITSKIKKEICQYSVNYLNFFQSRLGVESVSYYLSFHSNFFRPFKSKENNYKWNETICDNIALNGDLEILQWLRKNGCPWDKKTCESAGSCGKWELLQWDIENGCPWDIRTYEIVRCRGDKKMIKWITEKWLTDKIVK